MKPIIGITTFCDPRPRKTFSSVSQNYVTSVLMAGGIPILIPIINNKDELAYYLDLVDGLLFTGGEDISPLEYGEDPISHVTLVSGERDRQEIDLFKMAYEKHMPILGICRGIQLINVALGGSLYQDLGSQYKGALGHLPADNPVSELYHRVKVDDQSKLYHIFLESEFAVNSFHHQAIKELGKNLKVAACSKEGIIEGIESTDKRYLFGVQWHPEDLSAKYPLFLRLFKSFIEACASDKI